MDINNIIRSEYAKATPVKDISTMVGRHPSKVKERARKMGLSHPNSGGGIIKVGYPDSSLTGEAAMATNYEAVLAEECRQASISMDDVAYWWYKTQRASIFIKRQDFTSYDSLRDDAIKEMQKHAPRYKYPKLPKLADPTLQIFPRADDHFGKLTSLEETGMVYNLGVARKRAEEGAAQLLAYGQPFNVQNYAVILGNDVMHVDNTRHTTTAGTNQDTDGSLFTMFDTAKASYIALIERLAVMGNVYLFFVPSNHDWVSSRFMADSIGSWFRNNPRVHLGGENWWNLKTRHRKYMVFGENLIMFSHGDGAKENDLQWHLADEAKAAWADTSFRYVYLGHIHHKDRKSHGLGKAQMLEKDHVGFTTIQASKGRTPQKEVYVEYVRSQSATDGWHDRNGYTSKAAVESFIHHPTNGQIARFTHFF